MADQHSSDRTLKSEPDAPIGIFDSGVGGFSVLREIRRLLPRESIIYFADQAHVPHGSRTLEEVRAFCVAIVDFLRARGAKLIVVACHTDSAAALKPLRVRFADFPFVGMEPAVKPAVAVSRNGVIGVIATPATFQGELFASVVDRFAKNVRVLTQTMPGLVEMIEQGVTSGPRLEALLRVRLAPLAAARIDALVLGCTHYPFVRDQIAAIMGPRVEIIDPAPAVARQVERVLLQKGLATDGNAGKVEYFTSGDPAALSQSGVVLLGETIAACRVPWHNGSL
jgi:glutamate racemase